MDIYLYNVETGKTVANLCKQANYQEPAINPTKSMKYQAVNSEENLKNNPGYDVNPQFSPDGKYIAWQSMARNGYESDRNRLCIYELATDTKSMSPNRLIQTLMLSAGAQTQKHYISLAYGMDVKTYTRRI